MGHLASLLQKIEATPLSAKVALVKEVDENFIKVKGPNLPLGEIFVHIKTGQKFQVVKSKINENLLLPLDGEIQVSVGEFVFPSERKVKLPKNLDDLKGEVLDALGEPLSQKRFQKLVELEKQDVRINPLERKRIKEKIQTGVKAIDGMLTIGRGQKIGIFAGTGVGKSTLLGMLAKQSTEDVNVIALIGERGREVREFMERELGEEGMKRSVLVVATSDETPLKQIKAADLATTIAERFRDQGKNVLLMMDSVTRYLMAKRSIDIANGEAPLMGGKTTSMEPSLQKLMERSGITRQGSITGIYTVLVEGDDFNSPIPDMARGILDGHIVLTRALADMGHFPAIDVLASISRVMQDIAGDEQLKLAKEMKKQLSIYKENKDQIELGLIERGRNPEVDKAVRLYPNITQFLQQGIGENFSEQDTVNLMKRIIGVV